MITEGDFRPEVRAIAARLVCHPSAVIYHFGSLSDLYEHIAAVHFSHVCGAAFGSDRASALDRGHQRELAWLIMTGRKPAP